jgi:hypothetical protein
MVTKCQRVATGQWGISTGTCVVTSSPTGACSPAPLTDAFGDTVAGARQTYDWNSAKGDGMSGIIRLPHAPVAQWIERRPPEPGAQVRFLPGARYCLCITSNRLPAVMEAW